MVSRGQFDKYKVIIALTARVSDHELGEYIFMKKLYNEIEVIHLNLNIIFYNILSQVKITNFLKIVFY